MGITAASKKRKVRDGMAGKVQPKKKFKKQAAYHSSSEDDSNDDDEEAEEVFAPVNLLDSDSEKEYTNAPRSKSNGAKPTEKKIKSAKNPSKKTNNDEKSDESGDNDDAEDKEELEELENDSYPEAEEGDDDNDMSDAFGSDDDDNDGNQKKVPKRHDPSVFSTSISKILSTKLSTAARADPVLSRSKNAVQASAELANERLEQRARAKLRAEKKEELDRGRVRDVLGIERGQAGETAEEEKRLRKIAQRGVVKLFNAVRAAQVRGEEAAREEQKKGTIGMEERKKAANEVSKQSFLDLINGKKGAPLNIEEA
ncbi:uncharacterized protein TRUGW13939_08339 [Talaromyces rugulosus]|uniref:Rrp15p-domain-containing protein n=1 Tax=Talaromyces rugulosus TaxID=121627 RepID=A0A7H8R4C5_TALRU|nr:uncharacterized protein TRUGW13939_08339 [Talaromyces rugulosus]QKX61192.1 hypothetical protein TRUGW13939_08339 [Talaromyces rugulosus]